MNLNTILLAVIAATSLGNFSLALKRMKNRGPVQVECVHKNAGLVQSNVNRNARRVL